MEELSKSDTFSVPPPLTSLIMVIFVPPAALKCDLRDEPTVQDRLARYGLHTVQYEEGLTVARRIRASRYLGKCTLVQVAGAEIECKSVTECSSKHNRGVNEVFYEAARVSLSTRAKGSGYSNGGCVII